MGYFIQALIGKADTFHKHASEYAHARLIPLTQEWALIPITDELHDEIGSDDSFDNFEKLTPALEQWAQRISSFAAVAYVEAEFFGGDGSQSAVVWANSTRVIGPLHSKDAINKTLRYFGVAIGAAHDEFDAVGLGKRRDTHDWLA
jgi:hypothetical protein